MQLSALHTYLRDASGSVLLLAASSEQNGADGGGGLEPTALNTTHRPARRRPAISKTKRHPWHQSVEEGTGGNAHPFDTGDAANYTPSEALEAMECGISLHANTVLRATYVAGQGLHHPKDALISGAAAISTPFGAAVARLQAKARASTGGTGVTPTSVSSQSLSSDGARRSDREWAEGVSLAYPRGCTLRLQRPAVPLLGTGSMCYPFYTPVVAVCELGGSLLSTANVTATSGSSTSARSGASASNTPAMPQPALTGHRPGRLAVIGSAAMMSDDWLGRECNASVLEAALTWLLRQEADPAAARGDADSDATAPAVVPVATSDAETAAVRRALSLMATPRAADTAWTALAAGGAGAIDAPSLHARASDSASASSPALCDPPLAPDIAALSAPLRPCLQTPEPLPLDVRSLFETSLFGFSMTAVPAAVGLYGTLGVAHSPLTLIPPQLETPMPRLRLAVFPPAFPEPPPPPLECFDLDAEWATPAERLASSANASVASVAGGDLAPGGDGEAELAAFLSAAGHILGIGVVRCSSMRRAHPRRRGCRNHKRWSHDSAHASSALTIYAAPIGDGVQEAGCCAVPSRCGHFAGKDA